MSFRIVHHDGQDQTGYGEPLDDGTPAQNRSRRPVRPYAADSREIGRQRPEVGRGLHHQPLDLGAGEPVNPKDPIVDVHADRRPRERLHVPLDPWRIEDAVDDNRRQGDACDQAGQRQEWPYPPSRPATSSQPPDRASVQQHSMRTHDDGSRPDGFSCMQPAVHQPAWRARLQAGRGPRATRAPTRRGYLSRRQEPPALIGSIDAGADLRRGIDHPLIEVVAVAFPNRLSATQILHRLVREGA